LDPGETREVTWQFRPPLDFSDYTLNYRVLAGPRGGTATEQRGRIAVSSTISIDDAGPLLRDKKKVVRLGDSYSAGEGAGSYHTGTDTADNRCHRSTLTYATTLFTPAPVNLACSGAVTADIDTKDADHRDSDDTSADLPSQIDQLKRLRAKGDLPDLVLMTMGGNDVGLASIVGECVFSPLDCSNPVSTALPWGTGALDDKLAGLPASLEYSVSLVHWLINPPQITAKRGVAPIVVLAYPRLFPEAVGRAARCQGYVSAAEIAFANRMNADLNETLSVTIRSMRRRGFPVYFAADVADAVQPDHTMCGAAPWINDMHIVKTVVSNVETPLLALAGVPAPVPLNARLALRLLAGGAKAAKDIGAAEFREYIDAFHPNSDGYRAMTAALVRYSNSTDANTPVPPDPLVGATAGPLQGDPIVLQGSDTSRRRLQSGVTQQLTVNGLPPDAAVEISVRSATVVLARTVSDGNGQARAHVTVPSTLRPGRHQLEVIAYGATGDPVVLHRPVDVRTVRPRWWLGTAIGSPIMLVAGRLLWTGRRRLLQREGTAKA